MVQVGDHVCKHLRIWKRMWNQTFGILFVVRQNKFLIKKSFPLLRNVKKILEMSLKFVNPIFVYMIGQFYLVVCPVGWGCRIHRLLLCRGVRPPPNECSGYGTKQSDGEVPAVRELWGMRSTPSLPLLPGPLWPSVIASDRALSMG